jgi:serine O-acetyltransferase
MRTLIQDVKKTFDYTEGGLLKKCITCIFAPGVQAVIVFRFGNWISHRPKILKFVLFPIYMFLNFLIQVLWGIEIQYAAKIGPGFYVGHFGGITISGLAIIGSNANISQNITIGVSGQGDKRGVPVIGDNVYIAPGARVFGKIHIGNNVKIGANAVIHKSIPDNSIAVAPSFTILKSDSYKRSMENVHRRATIEA